MRAFVDGSRSERALSADMQLELAALVAGRKELLVGDGAGVDMVAQRYLAETKYRHVTIYTSHRSVRMNEGMWDVHSCWGKASACCTRLAGYRFEAVKSEAMALDAGYGLMAWDGRSRGTFLAILMLVALGKQVRVMWQDGASEVKCLDDVYTIIPPKGSLYQVGKDGLPPKEQERIADAFVPSRSMALFAAGEPLSSRALIEIILGLPAPLVEKYKACKNCARYNDIFRKMVDLVGAVLGRIPELDPRKRLGVVRRCWDDVISSSFTTCRDVISKALQALRVGPGELLYRKSLWDEQPELYEVHEEGVAPFDCLDAALHDLRREMAEDEWDADAPCWTVLEKWRHSDMYRMWCNPYTYYLIRDKVVYFEKNYWDGGEREWRPLWRLDPRLHPYAGLGRPSLPTPFDAGDIITLDCRPFAPLAHGLVLLPHNRTDGCKPYVLARNHGERPSSGRGPWRSLSLGNGAGLHISIPGYSTLYRAETYDSELPEEERVLKDVQRWLGGDRAKAKMLDDALMEADDGMSDDDLMAFMGERG